MSQIQKMLNLEYFQGGMTTLQKAQGRLFSPSRIKYALTFFFFFFY